VIEKLQSEIDRLKRDLLFESTRRHEVERREEAQKDALARLHREVENLERARGVDRGVLGRRERKVEELREEVAREVGRREKAEGECRERVGEAEEVKRRAEQSERRAEERAVQVAVEMKVLQDAYAATEASYRTRTETLERAFGQVLLEKEEEACKVKRLDVVVEQMGQELQRAERTNKLLSDGFKEYKQIKDEELRKFKEKASRDEERDYRVRQEMERVVEEARWLVTLGKRGLDESAMVGA
jgi:chromosome segregation ATPase